MSKRELIDEIRKHNHGVNEQFLERFAEKDLQAYLDRVCDVVRAAPVPDETADESELIVA